ncbi:TetR/AcrR family transcriptional regulator [Streptomyces sp. IB2014 016-6]|uniref:TetR/AcrR family transcriptional regulator n=1 Tax=Streptomyces sp. IB2014 016-6 TaxID=2517818 RepID=UPI0011CA8A64|nr:TetR/AcrR family transcriptional regulator [Streptomyces sp. IB2014 016-6]TXL87917.1 TetR/AcrR family transcriptional regulator [Streptomyces sp. IB2014 016-6]
MEPTGDPAGGTDDSDGIDGARGAPGAEPGGGDLRKAQRRERLLTTATDLFTTRGYVGTSIERICATAHVSIRAFYQEFEGREALLIALHNQVARAGMEATLAVLGDRAVETADTRTRITALIRAYVGAVTADLASAQVAFVEVIGVNRAVEDHRVVWRSLWTDFLIGEADRAVGRGEAVPRDHTLAMVALIGAINELMAHWARSGGAVPRELVADEMIRHVLGTIGHPTAPGDGAGRADEGA